MALPRMTIWVVLAVVAVVAVAAAWYFLLRGPPCDVRHEDTDGYAFCYPDTWTLEQGQRGTDAAVLAPLSGPDDQVRESVNLVVNDNSQATIQEAAQAQERGLAQSGHQKVSATFGDVDGEPAHTVVYTFRQDGLDLRGEQTVVLHGGRAYFVTFTAQQGHEAEVRSEVDAILDSFEFTS